MNAAAAFVAVLGARQPFNPVTSLFAHGEQGVVLDPSDLSTLYQDSAGTTPVTAVEQAVGLILDKSGRGNHAIQPGATNRPILRSRYNLLTYSEDFSNAAWDKNAGGTLVTANATTAPDGTLTADLLEDNPGSGNTPWMLQPFTGAANFTHTFTVWARAAGGSAFNIALWNNVGGWTYSPTLTATGTWQKFSVSATVTAGATQAQAGFANVPLGGIYIWGADVRRSNDTYLPYQRIAAATDYDTVGFPVYLAFDGSDDSLYTSAFAAGIDKAQVFSGVTKLSSTEGMIAEFSADYGANNGSFALLTPFTTSNRDGSGVRGTTDTTALSAISPPITQVLSMLADISAPLNELRRDGMTVTTTTTALGTGNFGTYALNIGRRNNASLPLNGRLYQLIVRFGSNLPAALIAQADRWCATKQGRAI